MGIYIAGFSIGFALLAAGITMMKIGWDRGRDRLWRFGGACYVLGLATWIIAMLLTALMG